MLLLIDNYDSFTYNLAQYFGELGCELVIKRNDEISPDEIAVLAPKHICISPGPALRMKRESAKTSSCDSGRRFQCSAFVLDINASPKRTAGKLCALPLSCMGTHLRSDITEAGSLPICPHGLKPVDTIRWPSSGVPFQGASRSSLKATTAKSWRCVIGSSPCTACNFTRNRFSHVTARKFSRISSRLNQKSRWRVTGHFSYESPAKISAFPPASPLAARGED